MKMENHLYQWVKEAIVEKLENNLGWNNSVEPSSLAYSLFEYENVNGSYTCSAYKAREWIGYYFTELADVVEDYEDEFGEKLEPFSNPEAFQVIVVIFIADRLLNRTKTVQSYWDYNQMELTDSVIFGIIDDLEAMR